MPHYMQEFVQIVPDKRYYHYYFHTYRRCPRCERDMLTDGRGRFRCDNCSYRDIQDVTRDRELYGYKWSGGWSNWQRKGFEFGRKGH